MTPRRTRAELERLLAKAEGKEGQLRRVALIRAELEQRAIEEANNG